MNQDVDALIRRSERWRPEMEALREVLLGCGLDEQVKWRQACYVDAGRNIAIIQEMKDLLALMFFKGALMTDPHGVMEDQGPNSRSARRMRFTCTDDVRRLREVIAEYVREAVAVEASGAAPAPASEPEPVQELRIRLDGDRALAAAWAALTPGRRREYILHFAAAKRAATREGRIAASVERILAGKGLRDR